MTIEQPSVEWCRSCSYRHRRRPAEFIVWGRRFPPEALGPRCYDCAVAQIGHAPLYRGSKYAVFRIADVFEAIASRGGEVDAREATG